MTAQVPERLHFEGESHILCSEPLANYFALAGVQSPFTGYSTALWRGYVGTWEVVNDRLYLLGLEGYVEGREQCHGLESLFPGFPDRVFAHWFTGELRIPQGKLLKYVHGGYMSRYERDLLLSLREGVLTTRCLMINGVADRDAEAGHVIAAATSLGGPA